MQPLAIAKVLHCSRASVYVYCKSDPTAYAVKPPYTVPSMMKIAPYREEIDGWVNGQCKIRKNKRIKMTVYYSEMCLKYDGFPVSYAMFCKYIKRAKMLCEENHFPHLRLLHEPNECQADFMYFSYYDKSGNLLIGECLTVSFPRSGMSYIQAFPNKSLESLLFGLQSVFTHVGSVPSEVWLDNDSTAVRIVRKGKKMERHIISRFADFIGRYGIKPVFMQPYCGNEKGAVEAAVGFLRRRLLVPVPAIPDFAEFNKTLFIRAEELNDRPHYRYGFNILEQMRTDSLTFHALPSPYDCNAYLTAKVDSVGRVRLHGKAYFVDPALHKQTLNAVLSHDRVRFSRADGAVVLDCPRLSGGIIQDNIDWSKTLPAFLKYPATLFFTPIVRRFPPALRNHIATCQPPDGLKTLIAELSALCRTMDIHAAAEVISNKVR
ncbi:hypothetical protein FACS1894211_06550 [Clostridia bacterium]|nr:hypothetical protein FACS1894211_06550 [Clostridia bacterium]